MRTLGNAGMLIVLLCSLTPAESNAQPSQDAMTAYVGEDFQKEMRLAQSGDAKAQDYLSAMYRDGRGVARDPERALFWLREAAANGVADAQFALGLKYEKGDGVPQDYGMAATWWKKAADQGFYVARVYLGDLYADGRGVENDRRQALQLYGAAAEEDGGALARQKFGDLCLIDNCDAEYSEKAYEYLEINSSRTRFADQEKAASALVRLSQKMSPDQIGHAKVRAAQWLAQHQVPPPPR